MWQKHCLFSNLFLSRPCTASCQSRSQGETNDGAIVECVLLYKGSDESFLPVMWCRLRAMTYWICNVYISSPPRWPFLVPVGSYEPRLFTTKRYFYTNLNLDYLNYSYIVNKGYLVCCSALLFHEKVGRFAYYLVYLVHKVNEKFCECIHSACTFRCNLFDDEYQHSSTDLFFRM